MTLSNAKASEAAKQPSSKPVVNAVNGLVRSLTLDEAGKARSEVAPALAKRMDTPGTGATSLALLSRELRSVLAEMIDPDSQRAAADLIASIFSEKS
jgi:hypothetical protein